jgi:DNA-binding CsgD family transcriptional regulator
MLIFFTVNRLYKKGDCMVAQVNLSQYLALPQELLDLIPANISWKTKEGLFLGCNRPVAEGLQLDNTADMVGRTLEQVLEKKYALPLLEHDHQVISTKQEEVFEEVFFDAQGNQAVYLCRKAPLLNDEGNVLGLIAVGINVTSRNKLEKAIDNAIIGVEKQVEQNTVLQSSGQFLVQRLTKHLGLDRYYLPKPFADCYLTQRELDCVLLLMEGKSSKEIGRALNLSFRTIEFYIDKLKTKLNCRNRVDLTSKINSIITQ